MGAFSYYKIIIMKSKKKMLKLQTAKARKNRREKYIKTIVEPAERLADLITQMQKRKAAI